MTDYDDDPGDEVFDGPEPKASRSWLALIERYHKAGFDDYNERADKIDKEFANASRLAKNARDSEFQIFWANIQVLGPSIYSRPPTPVVTPRFKDRRPLQVLTADLLERAVIVGFELEDVDYVMRMVRDDLAILSRGVPRIRYETKSESNRDIERVCVEHMSRRDFAHDPARNWAEVGWVAFAGYLTRREMRKRFYKHSGDAYKDASYAIQKNENDNDDGRLKAQVWEIWSKSANKVVWVSEGCEKVLDEGEPHLKLEGFFPCPRPAYGTTQRGDLIPVPDYVYYQDQVGEINDLTARISLLMDALKVRAFYPAGAGEIGDAIETAIKSLDDRVMLVPIANWGMIGTGSVKDMLVWLPLDQISVAIDKLVMVRKQLIDDVYQITGLSDIMRGSTVASETLGAQQLKSQYGSVRVRDRQDEMVRIARDLTRMTAEIMAENFSKETLLDMTQMQIETDADINGQVKDLQDQVKQALADPEIKQRLESDPEAQQMAQEKMNEVQGQIGELKSKPTVEKVMKLLRDEKIRPFALDIETDSTIAPDENAQKQRATEYVTAMSQLLAQAQIIQTMPQLAPVLADAIRFMNSQFRAGREVQATVEEFADQMKQMAGQPKPPDPAQQKAEADAQAAQAKTQTDAMAAQADAQRVQADATRVQAEAMKTAQEAQSKAQNDELERQVKAQEATDAAQARQIDLQGKIEMMQAQIASLGAKTEADAARAQWDMQSAAEKHAQELEIGDLNIRLLLTKIDQAAAATMNAERSADANIAVKTAPKPPSNGAQA